ncbi:MAG: endolytic transglycosylase MltG [Flavobacteriales bacterium]|nr:endolytic transglycosylase MltG [Flavobacteriales bacterium]
MRTWKIVVFVALVLAMILGALGWRKWKEVFGPGARFEGEDRVLLIPTGATFDQVVDSIMAGGSVEDEQAFIWLAERKKYPAKVRPGRYRIASGTSLNELVNKLRAGEQDPVKVTFTNIDDLPELAGRVARYLEPDSTAMLWALRDPATQARAGLDERSFISLFIPNTYEFWWTTTPEQFIARMRKEHDAFWNESRMAKARSHKLDPVEVATLASIVQAETMRITDAPRIAGVYLNRLRIGMPLQADPTLKFALGLDSVKRVLDRDKIIDSPYNTYRIVGLPPGPINMPEPRFIDAVLNAEKHDFLYFCAKEDLSGYSNFSRTYEQHLVNARRYQRALNERKIFR